MTAETHLFLKICISTPPMFAVDAGTVKQKHETLDTHTQKCLLSKQTIQMKGERRQR